MTGPNHPSILPKHTTRGTIDGFLPSSNLSMWPRNYNHIRDLISQVIIRQIFSLAHDWSKHVTWPNIPQLKLGNIREKSPIVKTAHAVKKIWWIINMTASIWGENMLRYLSLDINCLFFEAPFLGTENARGQISKHIFAQNGGYGLRAKLCKVSARF